MVDGADKTTQSLPVAMVPVSIIGTGDVSQLATGTVAVTAGQHVPNLQVEVIAPAVAILVRFINNYLTTLVGLVTAAMTPAGGKLLNTGDFTHLLLTCGSLAFAGPALAAIKDCITIFSRLESRWPLLTGSV